MPDIATLSVFTLAVMLLLMSPGPNMAFVVTHGVAYGWRGGVASALGIGAADLVLTALTATGLTALIAGWPPALDLIRYLGAVYLVWMAFNIVRASQKGATPLQAGQTLASLQAIFVRAMLNSLLNPKALLFFLVFLPQFVVADRGGVTLQLTVLGCVLTLIAIVFHAALGSLGGAVSRHVARSSTHVQLQAWVLAVILMLLALRLVLMQIVPPST